MTSCVADELSKVAGGVHIVQLTGVPNPNCFENEKFLRCKDERCDYFKGIGKDDWDW